MNTAIAKCENCGAALRIEPTTDAADCTYCGVTSTVGGGTGDAPRLRVDPPPPIAADVMGPSIGAATMFLFAAVAGHAAVFELSGWGSVGVGAAAVVLAALAGAFVYFGLIGNLRTARELRWFRDHGIAGRATVERISAHGDGKTATLGLAIELEGRPERQLDHTTTIPPLLIPQLTKGLKLPVIVHPDQTDRIEVQWHLV
jgi:hypothetical protein